MDKRVVWIAVGVAVFGTVVWLAMRPDAPAAGVETPSAATSTAVTPEPAGSVTPARPAVPVDTPAIAGAPSASAAADLHPIDISPGFEYLGKPASEMKDTHPMWTLWRRHQVLQGEPRDEAWASRQEASLRKAVEDSLTARGLDTQRIELPVIECRTNGCEIQAVGWSEDSRPGGFDLQHIMHAQLAGDLGNEFDREALSMMMSSRPDHRSTFLVHLTRKKP